MLTVVFEFQDLPRNETLNDQFVCHSGVELQWALPSQNECWAGPNCEHHTSLVIEEGCSGHGLEKVLCVVT